MKRTFLTAFALLSLLNTAVKADEIPNPTNDTTAVRHLNLSEVKINASRVSAKMKDLPQKVEVITARRIESTPANDIGELLKKSTGLDIIQYPGIKSAVGMRGFSPSTSNKYNVILVNGKPAGTENIATLNMANVERVEILKGPFSSLYGSDAMAGVINIITKKSDGEIGGNISFAYGSFETTDVIANVGGDLSEKFSFDFAYSRHQQNKDYKIGDNNFTYTSKLEKSIISEDTYGERMVNTKFTKTNYNLRLGYEINDDWTLNLNTEYFLADDVETPGSFWHVNGMDRKDLERYRVGFDLTGVINQHHLSFAPYYSKEDNDYFELNSEEKYYNSSNSVLKVYGFQAQDKIVIDKHTLVIGLDSKTNKYENLRWEADGAMDAPYNPDNYDRNYGAFVQMNMKLLNDALNISLGGRYDYIKFQIEANELISAKKSDESYSTFNPNLGLKYKIVKNLSVHSSFGTAFLAPSAYQVAGSYSGYYNYEGNSELDPEKSRTVDFGFTYDNFKKGIKFDVTYFDTHHDDMIVSEWKDQDNNIKTYNNANESDMNGLEIEAAYDFGALSDYNYSLRLYANYTHLFDTKMKLEKDPTEYDLRYVREKSGNFGVEFDNLKGFYTRLNARYSGHRYEDNWYTWYSVRPTVTDGVLKHPDFMTFDYSANYTIKDKYTLGLSIANLLDENYTEKDGYNMPGRAVTMKFNYKF
ncbi:TonB-dependent receptor [Marinifilum sp. N1E240]|uniref:TonB-dependent receptor plug domain-containing protein n=1 Tax=Marinifilum sp. N1E240 TaxID=2608082 RepID=UPI00128B4695|nr:TonB-dependent receptor [Marinifilum sp. N1E240]MPQ47967.1 TonB-dependent receptor [Marinifilum sp. N1E240]